MNDVAGVEAMGDAAFVQHDQAAVGKYVQRSADDLGSAELDANGLADRREAGAVHLGDVFRQSVVGNEHRVEHVCRVVSVAQPRCSLGRPPDVQPDPDHDVGGPHAAGLSKHSCELSSIQQQIVRPFQLRRNTGDHEACL